MIRSLTLSNFLSFGAEPTKLDLGPMNLLIGPNAAGKSNLLRALRLLSVVPTSFMDSIRAEGAQDWGHKSAKGTPIPRLTVELDLAVESAPAESHAYSIAFDPADAAKPAVAEETIVRRRDNAVLLENRRGAGHAAQMSDVPQSKDRSPGTWTFDGIDPYNPFLHVVRSPRNYPVQGAMADAFQKWAFYTSPDRDGTSLGDLQRADLASDRLLEDGSNLAAVLHERESDPSFQERLREAMRGLYEDYARFHVQIIPPGYLQLNVHERRPWGTVKIPWSRLSGGTLQLFHLFAILADPTPPPLICIDEPEAGLHPDAILVLSRLLKDAATRTQLVVTTHSDLLVDAFRDTPEAVVICERRTAATTLQRLDRAKLAAWLNEYSLGDLWLRGDLGGTRW